MANRGWACVEHLGLPGAPSANSASLNGKADTFRLLSGEDLLHLPPPEWLLDELVPVGFSVLYGASSSGKSFVALDWALSVAAGMPWFGREVKRQHVLYVAAEGRSGLGVRFRAWRDAHGQPDCSRARFLPEAVNLRDDATIAKVRRTLDELPERPGLLVIHTVARTIPGADENSAKDLGEFVAAVDALRAGGSVVAVHHTGKDAKKDERGSSALRAAADMTAKLERTDRSPRLELTCVKVKDAADWPRLELALEPVRRLVRPLPAPRRAGRG